jgi:polyisoprenoid-binding protein YceI
MERIPKMLKTAIVPFGLLLAAAPAMAAPAAYQLSSDHTDVTFTINHIGFSMKHGWFRDVSGVLNIDPAAPEGGKLDVTIKSSSVDTNSAQRDKDISAPGWLDVAKFPELRFVSTKVARTGSDTADVTGDLTLHGVTKPVTLKVKLNKAGPSPFTKQPSLGFTATASLKRSDYGMTQFLPAIGDQVDIVIDSEFSAPK